MRFRSKGIKTHGRKIVETCRMRRCWTVCLRKIESDRRDWSKEQTFFDDSGYQVSIVRNETYKFWKGIVIKSWRSVSFKLFWKNPPGCFEESWIWKSVKNETRTPRLVSSDKRVSNKSKKSHCLVIAKLPKSAGTVDSYPAWRKVAGTYEKREVGIPRKSRTFATLGFCGQSSFRYRELIQFLFLTDSL